MREKLKTKTSVVATVFDSAPPMRWVAALIAAPIVAGAVLALIAGSPVGSVMLLAGVAGLLAFDLRWKRRPRQVSISCDVGALRGKGMQTLRARHIVGATTARHGAGVSLVLAHARRKSPVILDLPNDAALAAVSKSLGIGHHGFGQIGAVLDPPIFEWFRYLSTLVILPIVIAAIFAPATFLFSLASYLALAWFLGHLLRALTAVPKLVLTPFGLGLPVRFAGLPVVAGCTFVPFDAIDRVELEKGALVVSIRIPLDGIRKLSVPVSPTRFERLGVRQGRARAPHVADRCRG
jgi:hypothetical protein